MYTDATWANRAGNSSQGGYHLFVIDDEGIGSGAARCLVCVHWASHKLARMCRSSLATEARAAAFAVDALEWANVFFALILDADRDPSDAKLCRELGVSLVIMDAKAMYDTSRSATAGLGLTEKRTAIELSIVNERMAAINARRFWPVV